MGGRRWQREGADGERRSTGEISPPPPFLPRSHLGGWGLRDRCPGGDRHAWKCFKKLKAARSRRESQGQEVRPPSCPGKHRLTEQCLHLTGSRTCINVRKLWGPSYCGPQREGKSRGGREKPGGARSLKSSYLACLAGRALPFLVGWGLSGIRWKQQERSLVPACWAQHGCPLPSPSPCVECGCSP